LRTSTHRRCRTPPGHGAASVGDHHRGHASAVFPVSARPAGRVEHNRADGPGRLLLRALCRLRLASQPGGTLPGYGVYGPPQVGGCLRDEARWAEWQSRPLGAMSAQTAKAARYGRPFFSHCARSSCRCLGGGCQPPGQMTNKTTRRSPRVYLCGISGPLTLQPSQQPVGRAFVASIGITPEVPR
jgi:hypothetical protein